MMFGLRFVFITICLNAASKKLQQGRLAAHSFVQLHKSLANSKVEPLTVKVLPILSTREPSSKVVDKASTRRSRIESRQRSSSYMGDNDLEKKLNEAAAASHRIRSRISKFAMYGGLLPALVLFGATLVFWLGLGWTASGGYSLGFCIFFLMLSLFGVQPTDSMRIRVLNFSIGMFSLFSGIVFILDAINVATGRKPMPNLDFEDGEVRYICGEHESVVNCNAMVYSNVIYCMVLLVAGFGLLQSLTKIKGATVYDFQKDEGCRFDDAAFQMTPRQALNRLWFVFRVGMAAMGLITIIRIVLFKVLAMPWFTSEAFFSTIFCCVSFMAASIVFTPERRGNIMAYLASRDTEDESQSAAAIAALVGERDPKLCLSLAKENFRSICFSDLKKEDFERNSESQVNTLYAKAKPTKLRKCDAFISHSWSDNGEEKFNALKVWCTDFKTRTGRYPQLWLDKACIDQTSIDNDLLCLPIFLSGCGTLLIIPGPTYTSRLWCVIEVFVFLKMGGDVSRITILPIGMENIQEAKDRFSNIDVSQSQCYKSADREKLLAILEAGFGNFDVFNTIMRGVFASRVNATMKNLNVSGMTANAKKKTTPAVYAVG